MSREQRAKNQQRKLDEVYLDLLDVGLEARCSCCTKTSAIEYHDPTCTYRQSVEAATQIPVD